MSQSFGEEHIFNYCTSFFLAGSLPLGAKPLTIKSKEGNKMIKFSTVGVVIWVFLFAIPALAAGPDPAQSANVAESLATEAAGGSCSGCSGWKWAHVEEAWRYVSGSEERIWTSWRESLPSYAYVDTGDASHHMFIAGAASGHWVGTYWTSSTRFSNVRLWYY